MPNVNLPSFGASPINTSFQAPTGQRTINNPFMQSAMNATPDAKRGVNEPLQQAMFVGYVNNKPVYAGSRLSVLY